MYETNCKDLEDKLLLYKILVYNKIAKNLR